MSFEYRYTADITVKPDYKTDLATLKALERDLFLDKISIVPDIRQLHVEITLGEETGLTHLRLFCHAIRYVVGDENIVSIAGSVRSTNYFAEMYMQGERDVHMVIESEPDPYDSDEAGDYNFWCKSYNLGDWAPGGTFDRVDKLLDSLDERDRKIALEATSLRTNPPLPEPGSIVAGPAVEPIAARYIAPPEKASLYGTFPIHLFLLVMAIYTVLAGIVCMNRRNLLA